MEITGKKYVLVKNGKITPSASAIHGTAERPRLNVIYSGSHMAAQIFDDVNDVTLAAVANFEKDFEGYGMQNLEAQNVMLAEAIAKKALAAGITEVVFDFEADEIISYRVEFFAMIIRANGITF